MDRRSDHVVRRLATIGLVAGLAAALTSLPSGASAAPAAGPEPASLGTGAASPEAFAALQRDLGLTATQVRERLAAEAVAIEITDKIPGQFGADYAGTWLDDQQQLVVAVTDRSQVSKIRALGARPELVERSVRQLDRVKNRLDRAARPDPSEITGWRVDVTTNSVVVTAKPGATAAAHRFIRSAGLSPAAVRVETSTESPRLLFDVRGGDAYFMSSGGRCSIGHAVNGGFVTAGHCGNPGTGTSGFNQVSQGVFQASSFPTNDYAWVAVNSNWTPTPRVNGYQRGSDVIVAGGQEAPVGASICRSGSTTGWHCGSIQAKNQTVNYPQGTVFGLTRTNVCAEPGDSGGSWMSGQQAQGVTSGGSGNCTSGGTIFYQPLQEILSVYGLTLVTSGGGDPPPPPPPGGCDSYDNLFGGSLSGTGDFEIEPNGSYFFWGTPGLHEGCLSGPSGTDFDLYLQKWNGGWVTVQTSLSPDSEESLTYNGTSGYYRYVAYSFSGSGSYDLGINVP